MKILYWDWKKYPQVFSDIIDFCRSITVGAASIKLLEKSICFVIEPAAWLWNIYQCKIWLRMYHMTTNKGTLGQITPYIFSQFKEQPR